MQFTMKMVIGQIQEKLPDIKLVAGQSLVIGRTNKSDYLVGDSSISSRHASIVCDSQSVLLTDLGSRNGTYVNENKIKQIELSDEDKVRIGTCVFQVSIQNGSSRRSIGEATDVGGQWFEADSSLAIRPAGTEIQQLREPDNAGFVSEGSIQFGISSGGAQPAELRQNALDRSFTSEIEVPDVSLQPLKLVINCVPPEGEEYRIILNGQQEMSFGKTGFADHELKDSNLDDLHFRIRFRDHRAILIDNQSMFGTFHNGNQISQVHLSDGDVIVAGRTKFEISISGGEVELPQIVEYSKVEPQYVPYHAPGGNDSRAYQRMADLEELDSGLVFLSQVESDPNDVEDLIAGLAGLGKHYFILDFVRIAQPLPVDIDFHSSMLFDWIPAEAALQSPHLIEFELVDPWQKLVSMGWGCDGIILLQSDLKPQELLGQLRKMVRGSSQKGNFGGSINGICWPSVLSGILKNNAEDFSTTFAKEVNHVFFETLGGGGWQMFCDEKTGKQFTRKLGIKVKRKPKPQEIEPEPEKENE